jgi:hypothetical protein
MASGWPGKGHGALLKKWLSARSALQESPKTSLKHYENDVFGSRTGGTREREGVFQYAGEFSEVRGLVLLGALFESTVHLLEPPLRVGLKATGKQRNEQPLERFSLDETNTVLIEWLDGEGVLTIEQARHQ